MSLNFVFKCYIYLSVLILFFLNLSKALWKLIVSMRTKMIASIVWKFIFFKFFSNQKFSVLWKFVYLIIANISYDFLEISRLPSTRVLKKLIDINTREIWKYNKTWFKNNRFWILCTISFIKIKLLKIRKIKLNEGTKD